MTVSKRTETSRKQLRRSIQSICFNGIETPVKSKKTSFHELKLLLDITKIIKTGDEKTVVIIGLLIKLSVTSLYKQKLDIHSVYIGNKACARR